MLSLQSLNQPNLLQKRTRSKVQTVRDERWWRNALTENYNVSKVCNKWIKIIISWHLFEQPSRKCLGFPFQKSCGSYAMYHLCMVIFDMISVYICIIRVFQKTYLICFFSGNFLGFYIWFLVFHMCFSGDFLFS